MGRLTGKNLQLVVLAIPTVEGVHMFSASRQSFLHHLRVWSSEVYALDMFCLTHWVFGWPGHGAFDRDESATCGVGHTHSGGRTHVFSLQAVLFAPFESLEF